MSLLESDRELLIRYLNNDVSMEQKRLAESLLRGEPAAREFVRHVSEQAVMVADLERTALARAEASPRPLLPSTNAPGSRRFRLPFWVWGAASFVLLALLLVPSRFGAPRKKSIAVIARTTGSSHWFGANGVASDRLLSGVSLGAGDTLETSSCDAWIEIKLHDGSSMTLAGNSALRVLEAGSAENRFRLLRGSLWVSPGKPAGAKKVVVQTASMDAESIGAQFDLQASSGESMLRVNDGSVKISRQSDGYSGLVSKGFQVAGNLGARTPLLAIPQPSPIDRWACNLFNVPDVILGKWLPSRADKLPRLGVQPLLWPLSEKESVLIYAVALAAWKSTEHPVLLKSDSVLRFRGTTEKPMAVRFGFSTQKMRGAFAGKFEIDVDAAALRAEGESWEVELPLKDFRALYPRLAASPEGLELTDVYALTVGDDAGLEIHHIELRSP